MENQVIEALLSGQSPRQVCRWLDPPVSPSGVYRYLKMVIEPTMKNAEKLKSLLPETLRPKETGETTAEAVTQEAKQLTQQAILAAPALQIRENRIKLNQEIANRLMMVVSERAADMSVCERCRQPAEVHPFTDPEDSKKRCLHYVAVPGGQSGLIVRKLKRDGFEYAVDTGLLGEVREYQRQTAIELGQWQEGATGNVSIQILVPAAGSGEMPQVTFSSPDTLELAAAEDEEDGLADIGVLQKPE